MTIHDQIALELGRAIMQKIAAEAQRDIFATELKKIQDAKKEVVPPSDNTAG